MQISFSSYELYTFLAVFLTSVSACGIVFFFSDKILGTAHMLEDTSARQAFHVSPTPRIGGAAIVLAASVGFFLVFDKLGKDLAYALLAGLIVYAVGLREDISRDMSPKVRLLAALISAGLAVFLSGATVTSLAITQFDFLFAIPAFAIAVTMIWSAGACNALNLIDGLNGLASGYAFLASLGFLMIAAFTGDTDVQLVAAILCAGLLGFILWNWPYGLIFLGDAGAYAMGHILAWMSIILIFRNPYQVAGFAMLLVLFWPVADTAFAIVRRLLLGNPTDRPDRLHFHHLIMRMLQMMLPKGTKRRVVNSTATVVLMPFIAVPIISGVIFRNEPKYAVVCVLFFAFLFVSTYSFLKDYLIIRRVRKRRRPTVALEQKDLE